MRENGTRQHFLQHGSGMAEHAVASRIPAAGIVELKIRDVEVNGAMAAEDMHIAVFHGLAQCLLIKGPARQQSAHGTGDMHQRAHIGIHEADGPERFTVLLDAAQVHVDAPDVSSRCAQFKVQIMCIGAFFPLPDTDLCRDLPIILGNHHAAQAAARQFQEGCFGAALKQREHHLVTSHDALGAICPHQAKRAGHIFIAGMLSHHIYSPIIRLFSRNRCAYQQSSAGTALSKRYVCAASGYFSRSTSLMNIRNGRT